METQSIMLDVNISPEVAKSKYANLVIIGPEDGEVFLDFIFMSPTIKSVRKGDIQARIVMTPTTTKRTLIKLLEWLKSYELINGEIPIQEIDDIIK